ncbi:MAG: hypothetical protein AAF628_24050 [Planctomycetota bacterium]
MLRPRQKATHRWVRHAFGVEDDGELVEAGLAQRREITGNVLWAEHALIQAQLDRDLATQFFETLGAAHGTALSNLNGPTEATIDIAFYDLPGRWALGRVPTGRPIDGALGLGPWRRPAGIAGRARRVVRRRANPGAGLRRGRPRGTATGSSITRRSRGHACTGPGTSSASAGTESAIRVIIEGSP